MMHTVGASDKYDPSTTLPLLPDGLADPDANPVYPQRKAEIMAGRIAISPTTAEIPSSLKRVLVGPKTAAEISWAAK
jgi:hypothetical protein